MPKSASWAHTSRRGGLLLAALLVGGADDAGFTPGAQPDAVIAGPQGAVGQFAVECGFAHAAHDDPLVHHGHAGMSHRHDFFGNTTTNADSTYESLLAGDTTCEQRLDTAAYWAPSLLDGDGDPVEPRRAIAYYRAGIDVDPTTVEPYPPGMAMIAGDAAATAPQPLSVVSWSCGPGGPRRDSPPVCPYGAGLRLHLTFPDCWDGVHATSDDHRSHVAYSYRGECGDAYPVPIPQLQLVIDYVPVAGDPGVLSLASGPITSAHADFWNAWDQAKLERDVRSCLYLDRVCSLGDDSSSRRLGTGD